MSTTPDPSERPPRQLITLREAARRGYASRDTLTELIQAGQLPAVRLRGTGWYKVEVSDLDALLVPVVPEEVAR